MSNLKKILALMFVVSVLICCSAAFADEWNCPGGTKFQQDKVQRKGSYEGNGFDSPEDAVKCYNREVNSMYYSIEAYCLGYPDDFPKLISLHTNEEVEEFLKKFSSEKIEKFSKLSNVKFLSPDSITDNRAFRLMPAEILDKLIK